MKNLPGIAKWVKLNKGFYPNVSPSKLSLFRNSPSMFICRYGFGKKQQPSAAMFRGIFVEDAVVEVLTNKLSIKKATDKAKKKLENKYPDFSQAFISEKGKAKIEKEMKSLAPMIEMSCDALVDFGVPEFDEGQQKKIGYNIEGDDWSIAATGYLDLVFPNGQVIDLKTTHQMPQYMSEEHQLQRAFYKTAMNNHEVRFLYVTPRNASFLEDGDEVSIMEGAKGLIKQLDNFCHTFTPDQARKSIPIGSQDFYWFGEDHLKNFYNRKE